MVKGTAINEFIWKKKIAIFGVSRHKNKFGNYVYKELKKKNLKVYGLNPNMDEIFGDKCYPDLSSLPEKADAAFISVHSGKTDELTKEVVESGIRHIWFQQGTGSDEALTYCRENGIEPISGECILMYAEPVESFHAFHRWLWKVFGKLKTELPNSKLQSSNHK